MLNDIGAYLKWFEGVNKRAMRDVGMLPGEAAAWRPNIGEGENAWSIGEIVGHMASSRIYFANAYRDDGWITEPWPADMSDRSNWLPVLEESASQFITKLQDTPNEWLNRKIELIGSDSFAISGWRVLMMMVEHDIHHRSQIDSYAGLNGWEVAQIFDRTAEWVGSQQPDQRRRKGQGA
jgi:uncharacterized damage-inducible protein DinB